MKKLFQILLLVTVPFVVFSETISQFQAEKVAINFYSERVCLNSGKTIQPIKVSEVIRSSENDGFVFIINISPSGWVMVSSTSVVLPVLAYSFDGKFPEINKLPNGFLPWLENYTNQLKHAIDNNQLATAEIRDEWNRLSLENFTSDKNLAQLTNVAPLLISKWDQDTPYNNMCPVDPAGPGGRCLTGCVATAMGQLLYYYRFPNTGSGGYSYNHPDYGIISADFGSTNYYWEGMPSLVSKESPQISELLFHQGVSVDMDYGPDGSGMWNHKAAYSLKTYFRYGPETQYYFRDSVSIDWDSLLITNLDQRKPLYYAGWAGVQSTSGHAFVCDGYQPGNYYHFNWGWGGSLDGYFYTDNLNPGGSNFNFAQEVIPLFPDTIQNMYPINCQGNTTYTNLRGSIEDGSGWYNYAKNADCSWLIAPQDVIYDSVKSIKLTFQRFSLNTDGDTLYIHDGIDASFPLIGAYTGNALPSTILTNGNKAFLRFVSNSALPAEGWHIDYESNFPVFCTGTTTLTSQNGSFSDGSSEKNYSSNSMCRWKIIPENGLPVTLYFTSFKTFDSTDFVKVYDLSTSEILGTFTGSEIPPAITAQSGKMMVLFISNGSGNDDGWEANYYASAVDDEKGKLLNKNIVLSPNPGANNIIVSNFYFEGIEHELPIRVLDINGRCALNKNVLIHNGFNTFSVNTSSLIDGTYLLIMGRGDEKTVKRLVIKK